MKNRACCNSGYGDGSSYPARQDAEAHNHTHGHEIHVRPRSWVRFTLPTEHAVSSSLSTWKQERYKSRINSGLASDRSGLPSDVRPEVHHQPLTCR